jgi:excisionase family DNA binding protein
MPTEPILPIRAAPDPAPPAASNAAAPAAALPLLFTSRETARLLGISERTLWALTRRGEVPAVRIGRAVRYDRRDLIEYVDRLRAAQASGRPHG